METAWVAGTFALLGTLLGAALSGLFALRAAALSRDAQRALANDAARRDWRKAQLSDLYSAIAQRPVLYFRLRLARHRGDQGEVDALVNELSTAEALHASTWRAAGPAIAAAADAYLRADLAYLEIFVQTPPVVPADEERARDIAWQQATEELARVIEERIFGD
jgi:hypothetical protein